MVRDNVPQASRPNLLPQEHPELRGVKRVTATGNKHEKDKAKDIWCSVATWARLKTGMTHVRWLILSFTLTPSLVLAVSMYTKWSQRGRLLDACLCLLAVMFKLVGPA